MKLYIEDLLIRLANEGPYMWSPSINLFSQDVSVISSLSRNPLAGKGYTAKQQNLVLRLCKKYRNQLVLDLGQTATDALDTPEFKFALVENQAQEKSVTIVDKEILVKFPYSDELIQKIRKFRESSITKLVNWNDERKAWIFGLEENNILWISNNIITNDYIVDDQFKLLEHEIFGILTQIEDFVPTIKTTDTGFNFANTFKTVPQPEKSDLKETMLLAKYYGISTWDENIENSTKTDNFSPVLVNFLKETEPNLLEFDTSETHIDQFTDLFKYNCPALIIIPGLNEFFTLKHWVNWLKSQNIEEKDISVMFRLPNDSGSMFNDLVKQYNLNSPISENTKVVFISQKLPKPVIKSGIDFKFVLNLGSISGVHYSLSNYLTDRMDVIRYTDKNKSGYQFGLL